MNWGNYDSVLRQLREAGLLVEQLVVGQRHRCRIEGDREKRGWYHLHEMRLDGGGCILVGSYGSWRGNDPGTQKIELERGTAMSAEQRAALKARITEDRKAAEIARKGEAARAAARAQSAWRKLAPDGESDYLARKQVLSHGLRFSPAGTLAVPMLDAAGAIHGLQLIYPASHPRRKRLARDKDFWPAGATKHAHFFPIGSPAAGRACLVAEGYATAASLHQATGYPVVVAFDAGNLLPVAQALRKRYPKTRLLICADDDYLGKCRGCGKLTPTAEATCRYCAQPAGLANAGAQAAHAAALAVGGAVATPMFAEQRNLERKGHTDFNDLHVAEGLHQVQIQIDARLSELGWLQSGGGATHPRTGGGGDGDALTAITSVEALHERYALVYDAADVAFDAQEHCLVALASMRNLCANRQLHRQWMESHDKRVVRMREVGFDPGERDDSIRCNLWGGWPTRARSGCCDKLLELGEYLCSRDPKGTEMWRWLQRWLAYPIQHPGAKMKTAVIMHGPQGTGKNLFFEAVLRIYGEYGQIVDQDAIEDKHNDFLSRKLMLVADEVVARAEMYHSKNKLKNLITSDWIRINPKHIASYRERNHVQVVFLSNEVQPMALERDDRRYAVIWTPGRYDEAFYNAVLAEIDAGGIEALHQRLLEVDLAGFGPATLPPMTQAKRDLVDLGLDSSERFYGEWVAGNLPLPRVSCRSEDLYAAYRHFSMGQGVSKPAQMSTFLGTVGTRPGVQRGRHQHYRADTMVPTQSVVITPAGAHRPDGLQPLADAINQFSLALKDWKRDGANAAPDDDAPY